MMMAVDAMDLCLVAGTLLESAEEQWRNSGQREKQASKRANVKRS